MVVQQHVLNWLYSVLTSEYHDVNRTYNDVAQALSQYPSLAPRTDVHTFPNGASALLLHLSGTIPVTFRGTTYRFPISIWVPHAYPREAPLAYVTPTENMVVRPGQHVDPQGQVYHPYLVGWSTFWDKSTILDFLAILRDIFAKEPPVIARQQTRPPSAQQQPLSPPPVPPLPPDLAPRPPPPVQSPGREDADRPPPPPPKPGANVDIRQPQGQPSPVQRQLTGPPLPPHPPSIGRPTSQYGPESSRPQHEQQYSRPGPSRYDTAPPLPPQEASQIQPQSRASFPVSQQQPQQGAPYQGHSPPVGARSPPGQPQSQFSPNDPRRISTFSQPQPYGGPPPPWQQQQQQQQPQYQPPPNSNNPQSNLPPTQTPTAPDLMDEDLTLSIPSPSSVPAPPIPPNPEKNALLHQLAQTLHAMRQQVRAQNESSLQGLQAQRSAMQQAVATLQTESAQLSQLSQVLGSNTAILQDSLRRADGVIESSARLPEPDVDELLVAQTVVGNQLYELVAEERALADAIFVLGRAVERGRISPGTFAKMTRGLAREWYLKKALVRKIGVGMGLAG
ncbi:UEV domain-containing protein [Bombardia bombarda]|uniref:UEV domain-containing protein n=1 Tax=Bombardia bombarda TaxID=252184 RepID=A0AA40BVM4_9PEZI|nr:UEV domain-containing protein [Bombardia bombarda]